MKVHTKFEIVKNLIGTDYVFIHRTPKTSILSSLVYESIVFHKKIIKKRKFKKYYAVSIGSTLVNFDSLSEAVSYFKDNIMEFPTACEVYL